MQSQVRYVLSVTVNILKKVAFSQHSQHFLHFQFLWEIPWELFGIYFVSLNEIRSQTGFVWKKGLKLEKKFASQSWVNGWMSATLSRWCFLIIFQPTLLHDGWWALFSWRCFSSSCQHQFEWDKVRKIGRNCLELYSSGALNSVKNSVGENRSKPRIRNSRYSLTLYKVSGQMHQLQRGTVSALAHPWPLNRDTWRKDRVSPLSPPLPLKMIDLHRARTNVTLRVQESPVFLCYTIYNVYCSYNPFCVAR